MDDLEERSDLSSISESNTLSSVDDSSQNSSEEKRNFVDAHNITLRLNDFDHVIKVPGDMLEYDSSEDSVDDEVGPYLVLKLKNVKRLIQSHSASNSQDISNIKYFVDDPGVWKVLEERQRFPRNQLEKGKLAAIQEEGIKPNKSINGQNVILINGQNSDLKFNFELRLQVEGFRKQFKRSSPRLHSHEQLSGPNIKASSDLTLMKLFTNTQSENRKSKQSILFQRQMTTSSDKVVTPKDQQVLPQFQQKVKPKIQIKVSTQAEELLNAVLDGKQSSQKESVSPVPAKKPVIKLDLNKVLPNKANQITVKLPFKEKEVKASAKTSLSKIATDSESSDEELLAKINRIKDLDKQNTQKSNNSQNVEIIEASKGEFVHRSEFNKLQNKVEELEAKLLKMMQKLEIITNSPSKIGEFYSTGQMSQHFNSFNTARTYSGDLALAKIRSQQFFEDRPDVVFAYADVMQKKNKNGELKLLKANEMLQPDLMYEKIIQQIRQNQLDLTVKRTPLNYKKLQEILVKKIRIVFILCHGVENSAQKTTSFCLENVDQPTELDELDEERLHELLHNKVQCETIVISACHSSRLAHVLHKLGNPDITVVAINSREPVLEKAAMTFNEVFLRQLLQHNKVDDAYEHAIGAVGAMGKNDSKCCCCFHAHKKDCLWSKYRDKFGIEAAHELHTPKCKCYTKSDKDNYNDHAVHCKYYIKFYTELRNVNQNKFIEQQIEKNFVKQPPQDLKSVNKRMIMCCCCIGEAMHNEREKFVILGNKDKVVFPVDSIEMNGNIFESKCDFSQIFLPENNLVDRNCRAEEKISMIKFLMQDKQRILNILGESGVMDTLVKAVKYAVERCAKNYFSKAVKIDLEGVSQVREITRKIFMKMMIFDKDPTEEDVISWFKHDTYTKNLSYLIIFDNYAHLERDKFLLQETNEFIQNLIEDTAKMKLVVISKTESLKIKTDQLSLKETLPWNALKPEQLVEIFKAVLETKNQLNLINSIDNLENHDIFKLPALEIQEIYNIIDQLKHKSLDDIYQQMRQSLNQMWFNTGSPKDPEIYNCNTCLQNSSKVVVDFVFLLSQIPRGICIEEIRHFKVLWPEFFGQDGQLLDYVVVEEATEDLQIPNDDDENKDAPSDVASLDEKSKQLSVSRSLLYFFEIDNLNELMQEQKFTLKIYKRDALNQLLINPPQNQDIEYRSLQEYQGLAINFLCLYGTKMLTEMVKDIRRSEVDHNILTLHLDYGIWRLDRDSKCPNFDEFKEIKLSSVEERFEVIEQSFTSNFLEWKKISNYFKPGACKEEIETAKDLFHLAKLIPTLLIEKGRVSQAILFIQNLKMNAIKQSSGDVLFNQLMAQMGLIQVSLELSYQRDHSNIKTKLEEIGIEFYKMPDSDEKFQGLGETYYLFALLENKMQKAVIDIKKAATLSGLETKKLLENITILEQRHSIRKKKSIFEFREMKASAAMEKATEYFQMIKSEGYQFGISKCNLEYVRIFIEEEGQDISIDKKLTLLGILNENEQTFIKNENWLQQLICQILKSKLKMANSHSQTDRDEANKAIDQARQIFSSKKIQNTWWLAEIVDQKHAILDEYSRLESEQLYFNFAKANPIVELDNQGNIVTDGRPIRANGPPISLFIRGPFLQAQTLKIRVPFKLNILTMNLLRESVQKGFRLLHLSSDFDGSQGLAVEEEGWAKKVLSPKQLKDELLQAKGDGPCKLTLVVLLIPKSEKLAKVFSEIGVKHVIAFDQTESVPIEYELNLALQFNYIYAFCEALYKQIAQKLDLRTAFNKAAQTVTDDLLKQQISVSKKDSKVHTRLNLAQYQTIDSIGIKPILLQRPEETDLVIYTENGPPNFINCSTQQGILTGFLPEDLNIYGHKEELYQTLKWILNDKMNPESTRLVHVCGVKNSGKSLFLRTLGRIFYQRNMFPFKISYQDFHQVDSTAKFKKVIYQMDADLKASLRTTPTKIENHSRDILWLLDNVHGLTPTLWEQFEVKLYKMCKQANIKIVLTSTFQDQETINPVFSFFELQDINKKSADKIQMRQILLQGMTDEEALNILHSQCEAEFDENDLDPNTTGTFNERIKQELAFKECENLPGKIAQLAKQLSVKVNEKFQTFADLRIKHQMMIQRLNTKRISKHKVIQKQLTKTSKESLTSPPQYQKQKSILKNSMSKFNLGRMERSATFALKSEENLNKQNAKTDEKNGEEVSKCATSMPQVKFKSLKQAQSLQVD